MPGALPPPARPPFVWEPPGTGRGRDGDGGAARSIAPRPAWPWGSPLPNLPPGGFLQQGGKNQPTPPKSACSRRAGCPERLPQASIGPGGGGCLRVGRAVVPQRAPQPRAVLPPEVGDAAAPRACTTRGLGRSLVIRAPPVGARGKPRLHKRLRERGALPPTA